MVGVAEKTVLILEDAEEIARLYEKYCKKIGVNCEIVNDIPSAVLRMKSSNRRYSAIVVDLVLGDQNGIEFIQKAKELGSEASIIVQTSQNSPGEIINVMKLGIVDYLIKPVSFAAFEKTIRNAIDLNTDKIAQIQFEKSSREVLRNKLEWLTYKESVRKSDEDSHLISTIRSLSTSLSQGSGIGAIVSLLDLLKLSQDESGKGKIVSNEVLEMLYSNQEIIRKQLDGLSSILTIAEEDSSEERTSTVALMQAFSNKVKSIETQLNKKRLKIRFSRFTVDEHVQINRKWIEMSFQELLLNAIKYSKPGTCIDIFFSLADGYFCFAVKNAVENDQALTDSKKGEVLVTRPFYRILPPVEEYTELEQYGLGLGLTAVDLVVNKHRGIFHIYNVTDHTSGEVEDCVMAKVFLPLDTTNATESRNAGLGFGTLSMASS
ncbi:hybrid sensor histidine kinase/response regulator [Leptospira wolffii]|uniref:ATP-binding response regulator n=1 Tax=Leptospira wolffii TaxID=409998 RepID=UPI001083515E|nr:response regulator [Leptospira wolffii]TGL47528.1 hybrid sensor histidine kinase/response regulator [Leptospira wolffii]